MLKNVAIFLLGLLVAGGGYYVYRLVKPFAGAADSPIIIADSGDGLARRAQPATGIYLWHRDGWVSNGSVYTAKVNNSPSQWFITDPHNSEPMNTGDLLTNGASTITISGGTFTAAFCTKSSAVMLFCGYTFPTAIPNQANPGGGDPHYASDYEDPSNGYNYYILVPH